MTAVIRKIPQVAIALLLSLVVIALMTAYFASATGMISPNDRRPSGKTAGNPGFKRGSIYDRNMVELAVDIPFNRLIMDTTAVKDRAGVESFISDVLRVQAPSGGFWANDSKKVVLIENADALDKRLIMDAIRFSGYDDALRFESGYARALRDGNADFMAFIGETDVIGGHGVSGVERECDYALFPSEEDGGAKAVQLTIDFDMILQLRKAVLPRSRKVSIAAFFLDTGELAAFCSNIPGDQASELQPDCMLCFPDVESANVFDAVSVAGMLETDPTLIEEYYCDGSLCDGFHGVVNLGNIIGCQAAIRNLMANNYSLERLADTIAAFNVHTRDLQGLYSLGFLSYSNDYVPPMGYVIRMIAPDGVSEYSSRSEGYRVSLSPSTAAFLKSALAHQSNEIKIWTVGRILVIAYEQGGIEDDLISSVLLALERF